MSNLLPPERLVSPKSMAREEFDRDYMKLLTCHYTDRQIRFMNKLVKQGYYPNRSELIRDALRSLQHFYATIWLELNGEEES